jgi:hypothetical protein
MTSRDDKSPPSERRTGGRKRVLLSGVVAYKEGAFVFNCRIGDLTATGAKLVIAEGETLPPNFYLINLKARTAYRAHLAWRRGGEAGVTLDAPIDLRAVPDSKYNYLARIWASRNTVNPSIRLKGR